MTRHRKPKALSPTEINRIVYDAGRLHDSLCRPLLDTGGAHYKAVARLQSELCATVREITGEAEVPWGRTRPAVETVAAPWSGKEG